MIPPVSEQLKIQLDTLDDEGRAYVGTALQKGQRPDITVLKGFEQRRDSLVRATMSELKARRSPSGWNSLCEYINHDLAPQVKYQRVR